MKRKIYTFLPVYKSTLWGGDKIKAYKDEHIDRDSVGESWEISAIPGNETTVTIGTDEGLKLSDLCLKYGAALLGKRCLERYGTQFPLLIKIIDTRLDLSVQVHPDDAIAKKRHNGLGKSEMWYMVETDEGATISCGLKRKITAADIDRMVNEGSFEDCLARYYSKTGDCFYIPAGRIHSIGGGNLLVEIQQSSDITYRIYDFNRRDSEGKLRQLRTEEAKEAIDYSVCNDYLTHYERSIGKPVSLVDCPYFKTSVLESESGHKLLLPDTDSFRIIIAAEGEITVRTADGECINLRRGHSALIAAEATGLTVSTVSHKATTLICDY